MLPSRIFILLILIIFNCICGAADIDKVKFFSSEDLKTLQLLHDEKGFHVKKDEKIIDVPNYYLEPELRNISKDQLKVFLNNGYIHLKQIGDNDFVLRVYINGHVGNKVMSLIISFVMDSFVKIELEEARKWVQEIGTKESEKFNNKDEFEKTVKDYAYQLYDKVLYKEAIASYLAWAKQMLNTDKEVAEKYIADCRDIIFNREQELRGMAVLQITERILKIIEKNKAEENKFGFKSRKRNITEYDWDGEGKDIPEVSDSDTSLAPKNVDLLDIDPIKISWWESIVKNLKDTFKD